jgi:hypothetical protein
MVTSGSAAISFSFAFDSEGADLVAVVDFIYAGVAWSEPGSELEKGGHHTFGGGGGIERS